MTPPYRPLADPQSTALLTLDIQPSILEFTNAPASVIDQAVRAMGAARSMGMQVIHVGLGFSDGCPELEGIVEGEGKEAKAVEGRKEWEL
ncbi:MAG: hypothetical protein LQ340_003781, partial [Diploschistes diacapsis]